MIHPCNFTENMAIDETALSNGELYTLATNKSAHAKQGTIAVMTKGTNANEIIEHILRNSTENQRDRVKEITMDFSETMHNIAQKCFPKATITIDLFHLIQLCNNDMQNIRVRLKREATAQDTKARKAWKKRLEKNASRRKTAKKDQRGRPPKRINAAYIPPKLSNGDTTIELLTRSRYLLNYTYDDWSDRQKERAKLLFDMFPTMKTAYNLVMRIRKIFKNPKHTKDTAKIALHEWCKEALNANIDEFVATVQTIQAREDEVLNYFVNHQTNAYAESFNAKMKSFRSLLHGVNDTQFFLYRLSSLFG
jgi:transposase